jgi:alpha-tubulin suppressor-like RCC1 family protein
VAVATGEEHTCALLANGTGRCWGQNIDGQLGDNSTERFRFMPVTVTGLTSAVAITAGRFHSCALLANGTVRCWGTNVNGSVGDGTRTMRRVPVPVVGLSNAVAIVAAGEHTCALLADGSVRCWGDTSSGVLGDGSTISLRLTPVAVNGLVDAVAIATGSAHSCAARVDGGVSCWGSNFVGQLGTGDATGMDQRTPIRITVFNAVAISGGNGHTCALLAGGGAQCWGWNTSGVLGDGTTMQRLFPTTVTAQFNTSFRGATRIAAGYLHTCATLASGSLACWGENGNGQLGDGTTTDRLRPPAQVSSSISISSVLSISLNIDPRVTLEDDVREATVTVLAACEEGQELHVDVVLTQGAVFGRGSGVQACVGGLGRYPIVISAPSGAALRAGAATVQADALIVDSGDVVDTQSWTRAVQVLGTDGSLEGSASGIGTGTDNGSVRVTGLFTAEDSVSLDQATLTVSALLLEAGGAGELVRGAGGAALVPLTLVARAGATPTAAIYQTASGVRPVVRAEVKSRDADSGIMEYLLTVDRATIPALPAGCSAAAATTSLRTRFSLKVGAETLELDLTVPWRCLGTQLRTP